MGGGGRGVNETTGQQVYEAMVSKNRKIEKSKSPSKSRKYCTKMN